MDSSHHLYSSGDNGISELVGSGFVNTIPTQKTHKQQTEYQDERSPTLVEEPSSPKSVNEPCRWKNDVIEKCYQGRFYSRAIEYYLLEHDPTSFGVSRCLMENCPQRDFVDPRDMLRHLKGCKYLSQGIYRCPKCNDAEKFPTTFNNKCSWDRPKMRERIQNTLRATVDTVKGIVGPRVIPKLTLGQCRECGQTIGNKRDLSPFPGIRDSRWSTSPVYNASSIQIPQEMNNTMVDTEVGELMDTSLLELQATSLSSSRGDVNHHDVYDSSYVVSDCSPSTSLPIELPSASVISTPIINISPTVPTVSPESVSSNHPGRQCPPADDHYMEILGGIISPEITADDSNHLDLAYNTWQPSSSTQLFNITSSHMSMPSVSRGQRGSRESRGHSLTIQTDHLDPALSVQIWENMRCHNTKDTRALNVLSSSALGNSPSPMSSTDMSSHPNVDICVNPFSAIERMDPPQQNTPLDAFSSPDSTLPSSSPEESPSSATSVSSNESLQCPHCSYRPKGKKENAKAYLKKHMDTHGNMAYKCEFCNLSYSRRDNRGVHIRRHHKSQEDSKKRRKDTDSSESDHHRSKRVLHDESGRTYT
ncbi:hypothetical protein Daesc_006670 [Daldinia eschscholtzii]|uniref:C2H2-type domain-containing protein n=1 Tax=Daldinia eschscholtzii TaxID=292717 RepID=A0AAX6MHG2_9PEZI